MCNLYRMTSAAAEVAGLFNVTAPDRPNVGAEVYPGYPGLVIAEGSLRPMTWGFPVRLKSMKPTSKPKPVNNARDDKLTSFMWRSSFESRRCLIPLTAWAEAEGPKGKMTRTWYSLPNADLFAVAGIWRPTDEWGDAYSMVMVDGCEQMADVHDRMPVILRADDCDRWMDAPADEARELVRTYDGPLAVERTEQLWRG